MDIRSDLAKVNKQSLNASAEYKFRRSSLADQLQKAETNTTKLLLMFVCIVKTSVKVFLYFEKLLK